MKDLELTLCSTPQTSQRKKGRKKIKQICLCVPASHLESLREQFGQFIFSEDQSQLSERSTFDQSSDLIYFSAEEDMRETKSNSTSVMKRMSGVRKSLLSATESKSEVPKLPSSGSENQKPADQKVHRKTNITKAATTNIETSAQNSIRKETKIGSFVFSDSSSDGSFVEFRKGCQPSKTISASQNEEKNLMKKLLTQMVAPKPEPTTVTSESDQSKAVAMQNTASDLILAKAIKNEITDASPDCTPSNDVNASMPEKVKDTVKSTSVAEGHLELLVNNFVEWSFLSHDDHRHICVSNSYNIRGYSFHIEINSNPLAGYPGQSNDNFAPAYRKCGILLVCDDAFPDPKLRLASNFVITLKARSSSFNDHIINCTTVFSAQNKTGGSLAVSEFIANPDNGLLRSDGSLCITIDVEFISNKELTLKLKDRK